MNSLGKAGLRLALTASSALALAVVVTAPAAAQQTNGTVRGRVLTAEGAPVANATVMATNIGTGQMRTTTSDANGAYTLTSLSPGEYQFKATGEGGEAVTTARLQVGVTATLDLRIGAPAPAEVAEDGQVIVVTGGILVETKTSEVATNVTTEQIENLPQNNRNFLNFAALAPGISVLQTDTRQTFGGGGIGVGRDGDSFGGPQINVFIDGVSLKSNINQGGIVGQDVSRGNPFSQLAVQEFRVLTNNFKAEYEDAGTAIITAITKSGTNEFHGEVFGTYQDQSLISRSAIDKRDNNPKPDLERQQYGVALGGPIIKDSLFFFANYEANIQDRTLNVTPGGDAVTRAGIPFDVETFRGVFVSPFKEQLGFGKLTWQIADNQLLELSASVRIETDLRDFGGQAARERGTNVDNDTYTAKLKHQYEGDGFLNDFTADYLKSDLKFGALGSAGFGRLFQGVIQVGGRADLQEVEQESFTFRDVVSLTDIEFYGDHLVKFGGKLSFQKYRIGGSGPNANPQFEFIRDATQMLDFTFPALVRFGGGDPEIAESTTQVGLFVQDDWAIDDHITLNLGLRWDYDSNAKNNDFVTPPGAVAALRNLAADPRIQPSFFDVEDYISTGNRKADLGNFAPRIGISYDLNADQQTVIFAGYGRYYDRALFRSAGEETLLTQFRSGELLFSRDGLPRQGRPTIRFQDSFLTPDGFAALLASLAADPTSPGTSELRLIPNNLKTPYTDQFSVGIRQRFGDLRTSLTYNYTEGKDQIGYAPLNRTVATNAGGFLDFIPLTNGFSNAVAAFNTRATKYHGVYVQVDKPYTEASGYGFGVAYTLAFSDERGFGFNFDFPNISARPFVPNSGDERHRLVLNGIVDLPLGFRLSGLGTFGEGVPFFVIDASGGFGARDILFPGNVGDVKDFRQIDLKLEKGFELFDGGRLSVWAEVFNVFDRGNVGGGDGFIPPDGNTNFGRAQFNAGPPRSFQFGAAFRF